MVLPVAWKETPEIVSKERQTCRPESGDSTQKFSSIHTLPSVVLPRIAR
jgi:hypothetical protein